jgi:tetratricopeptide (TPR) repeat protein
MSRALAAALALASLSAQAAADDALPRARPNIWQRAIDPSPADTGNNDVYQRELREGDEHVGQANSRSTSLAAIRDQVQRAIDAYRRAAAAQPQAAEPYFRIGMVLWSFYLQMCDPDPRYGQTRSPLADCSAPDAINAAVGEQAIRAWDTFEAKAPFDPRLSGGFGSILFSRALVHTKLATKAHLAAAARDYEAIVRRTDGEREDLSVIWGNLAETYMMVGRLDDSIDAYKEALRSGGRISTWYGLAVALDRDGRGSLARDVMLAQGQGGLRLFVGDVSSRNTFFVPRGEVFYYFALAEESLGLLDEALDHWNKYIASGAHPQYQPRAREHVDAMLAKRRALQALPKPPTDLYRMDLMR